MTSTTKPQGRESHGYVATLLGALAGATGAGLVTAAITWGTFRCDPSDTIGLDCLGVFLAGVALVGLGGLAGAVAGCWLALRLTGRERAGVTAALLLVLVPVTVVALFAVIELGVAAGSSFEAAVTVPLLIVAAAVPPLAARRLALTGLTSPGATSAGPPAPSRPSGTPDST